MSETVTRSGATEPPRPATVTGRSAAISSPPRRRWRRLAGVVVTLAVVAGAGVLSWQMWQTYMTSPWTRDGTVRAYVVSMAPEVSGRVVDLPVHDNQFVRKGDLLIKIDPRDYKIAVDLTQAQVQEAQADLENKKVQAERRLQLTDLATTPEIRQNYVTAAKTAEATLAQQQANLDKAKVNLERTEIHSPVDGWITNLILQQGDYADTGTRVISIVNADSYWVDGYFQETMLQPIKEGDPARIWLLGYREVIDGHVDSVARGINVANGTPNGIGLATVNPIFTWVRLAQRVPVRVHIDSVPSDIRLVAGMTATVQIDPKATTSSDPIPGP